MLWKRSHCTDQPSSFNECSQVYQVAALEWLMAISHTWIKSFHYVKINWKLFVRSSHPHYFDAGAPYSLSQAQQGQEGQLPLGWDQIMRQQFEGAEW